MARHWDEAEGKAERRAMLVDAIGVDHVRVLPAIPGTRRAPEVGVIELVPLACILGRAVDQLSGLCVGIVFTVVAGSLVIGRRRFDRVVHTGMSDCIGG